MGKNRDKYPNREPTYFFRRLKKLSRQGRPVPDAVPYPGDPLRAVIDNQLLVELEQPLIERNATLYLTGTDVRNSLRKKQVAVKVKRVSHCNPNLVLLEGVRREELHVLTGEIEARYSPEEDHTPPTVKSSSANDVRYSPEEDHTPPKVKSSSGSGELRVDFEPASFDFQLQRIRNDSETILDWSTRPIVAVMDTGIDFAYPNTRNIPIQYNGGRPMCGTVGPDYIGWDFVHDHNNPYDDDQHNKHGSRIAAIISETTGHQVRILPLKVIDKEGFGTLFNIFSAFEYLLSDRLSEKPKVVNASWGLYSEINNPMLTEYIKQMHNNGIWLVNAAGNRGDVEPGQTVDITDPLKRRWPACDSEDQHNVLTITTVSQLRPDYQVVENYSSTFVNAGITSGPDGKFKEPLVDGDFPQVKGSSYATPYASAYVALKYQGPNDLVTRNQLLRTIPGEDEISNLELQISGGVVVKVE